MAKRPRTMTSKPHCRAILLVSSAVIALSACGGGDPVSTTSDSPSHSAGATSPSATSTASSSPAAQSPDSSDITPDAELGPDTIGEVVTTDLVVRSLPEISDASAILEQALDAPTLLYVIDGPVTANGYDWYQVQPFGMHYLDFMQGPPPFGWVAAASREGEPWIAIATLECPEPEIEALRAMTDVARFACYGDDELVVQGQFGGCFIADPAVITPEWIYQSGCSLVPPGYDPGHVVPDPGGVPMRFEGEVGMPYDEPAALIRVSGHFDDPAARTCVPTPVVGNAPNPIAPELAILLCRAQFVVTNVERIDS